MGAAPAKNQPAKVVNPNKKSSFIAVDNNEEEKQIVTMDKADKYQSRGQLVKASMHRKSVSSNEDIDEDDEWAQEMNAKKLTQKQRDKLKAAEFKKQMAEGMRDVMNAAEESKVGG